MMLSPAKLLALSNRIYCLLLYLYPARFRHEYNYHMAQAFRDDVRNTLQESGSLALLGLWRLAFFDLLKTAVVEHIWEIFHMPIEKLTRWSGPAGAVGGVIYGVSIIALVKGIINSGADTTTALVSSFLVTIPLIGLGLFGLYKCLPTTVGRTNTLAFCAAVAGLFIGQIGSAVQVVWMNNFENIWFTASILGLGLYFLGFAGMGLIAMTAKVLGRWSFTPLLAAAALVGLLSFGYGIDPASSRVTVLLAGYAMSWLLLGVALWQAYREPQEPGLLA